MIISHEHRFVFLRTEKTAGSSIEHALSAHCGLSDILTGVGGKADPSIGLASRKHLPAWTTHLPIRTGALRRTLPRYFGLHTHATAAQVRDFLGERVFSSYFKFAVERNPWDRQVSLYYQRASRDRADKNFDRDMRSPLFRITHYTRLRNWEIYAIGNEIAADRVVRYESLNEDLHEVLAEIGLPSNVSLPFRRSGFRDPEQKNYREHYSPATSDLIARWYRREIDAFGYEF